MFLTSPSRFRIRGHHVIRALVGLGLGMWACTAGAMADTTIKDVLIGVRSFAFLDHPPVGIIDLALVFDPSLPVSERERASLVSAAGPGLKADALTVHLVSVPVTDLTRVESFRFVLLTSGLQDHFESIFEHTRGKGIMTLSNDLACVRAGRCVMGVAAQPLVRVLVNRAASEAAVIKFDEGFRMLITEF